MLNRTPLTVFLSKSSGIGSQDRKNDDNPRKIVFMVFSAYPGGYPMIKKIISLEVFLMLNRMALTAQIWRVRKRKREREMMRRKGVGEDRRTN